MDKILEEYENLKRNIEKLRNSNENDIKDITSNILKNLKFLRNSCANGSNIQEYISSLQGFFNVILPILNNELLKLNVSGKIDDADTESLYKICWQLIANLCVQNTTVQLIVWQNLGHLILNKLENEISVVTNIQLMIVYNIFLIGNLVISDIKIFRLMIHIWNKIYNEQSEMINNLDFFHILLEHFIVKYPRIVSLYGPIEDASERILLLRYISQYVRNGSENGPINGCLLNYISKEFKKKSDCVLKTIETLNNLNINPIEVFVLLEIISSASGHDKYEKFFENDHSLFLNVGSLLQQLNIIGKKSTKNIFTPMQKLEEVAPNSNLKNYDFEHEISFEFKKMLVRTLANLSYRNRINQNHARETGILLAICDCTTVDARNPLIKEWSILAIRNLCENCPENQEIIENLCKVGDAPNDLLTELNMEFGSLRINPNPNPN